MFTTSHLLLTAEDITHNPKLRKKSLAFITLALLVGSLGSTIPDYPLLYNLFVNLCTGRKPLAESMNWVQPTLRVLHSFTIFLPLWFFAELGFRMKIKNLQKTSPKYKIHKRKIRFAHTLTRIFFRSYVVGHILIDAFTHGKRGYTYCWPFHFPIGDWLGIIDYHPSKGSSVPRTPELILCVLAFVIWSYWFLRILNA